MNLNTSDIFSVVAILISLYSLTLTLYFQYGRKAMMTTVIGDEIRFLYSTNRQALIFILDFAIINKGAKPAVMVRAEGTIAPVAGRPSAPFVWNSFTESKNVGKEGTYKPWMEFTGYPTPVIVPGYGTIAKSIVFWTSVPYLLNAGEHLITLHLLEGARYKESSILTLPVKVNSKEARYLEEKCVANENQGSENLLTVHWDTKKLPNRYPIESAVSGNEND